MLSLLPLVALTGVVSHHVAADQVTISNTADNTPLASIEAARYVGDSCYSTRFEDVTWNNSAWTLTTTQPRPFDYHGMAFAANGYFGSSMASTGPFVQFFDETNGWPVFNGRQTFGTIGGFFGRENTNGSNFPWLYQYGTDSVISGIPAWSPLILELEDGSYLAANTSTSELSEVALTQDFKRGLAEWSYTWTPTSSNNLSLKVKFTAFADKLYVNRGYVQLEVEPSSDVSATIVNVLDGANAVRTDFVESGKDGDLIYTAVKPVGVANVTAWVYAGLTGSPQLDLSTATLVKDKAYIGKFNATIAQGVKVSLKANTTTTVIKHVGVASSDGFPGPQTRAKDAATNSMSADFSSCLAAHVAEWAEVLPRGSVSDFTLPWTGLLPENPVIIEKQITSVISTYDLLQNTISANAKAAAGSANIESSGISVCGLTSDCYGGQRFWDQDFWMHPLLATAFPESAKAITNLRIAQYPQAKENVKMAFSSSQNTTQFSDGAALYPWTSGRDANCTATGPCFDYEYHLNGDISRSFVVQWASSGDASYMQDRLLPIMESISTAYSDLMVKNGSIWSLKNMTDPDEYANFVVDGGFTMALISNIMNDTNQLKKLYGGSAIDQWSMQAESVARLKSGDISLEFEGMNGTVSVKQADVVLKIYPLSESQDYTLAEQQADLAYYAAKQSPNGPGMTFAIFSISASAIDPSGCSAFTYDENSWSPYLRGPWFSFSEQLIDDPATNGNTNPAFPFLTGHGGFLQVDVFGYLGLRRTVDYLLRVNPSLPPQIEHIAYPTIYHQGWPVDAVSNTTHTTLTRSGKALSTANQKFANAPITVVVGSAQHSLHPGSTVTTSNRMYAQLNTEANNLLQCKPVTSPYDTVPGLFPNAATDGTPSTAWQPTNGSAASLTVDISSVPFQQLDRLSFNWGSEPPKTATVMLHNYSDTTTASVKIELTGIKISLPYDASTVADIASPAGNTTMYNFTESVWSGNYVTLVVEGNQFNETVGASGSTVAEFSLVGKEGSVV